MKNMKSFVKKTVLYMGYMIQVASFFALMVWVQLGDPKCILESTSVISQVRLCDPKYSPDFVQPSLSYLALIALIFALGTVCVFYGGKK